MEEIPDKIGPQKIAHLEKQNQKLTDALEEIAKNETEHYVFINTQEYAQKTLDEISSNSSQEA